MRSCLLMMLLICLIPGCKTSKEDTKHAEAEKMVSQWQGRKIHLVKDLPCRVMGDDTVASDLFDKPCKILVYVDSVGCTECRLRLGEWKGLIEETKPVQDKVSFLFIFQTKDREELDLLFLKQRVRYPYFQDYEERILHLNNMSSQIFLLDSRNKVVLTGSPVGNTRMWRLYREQISRMLDLKEGDWPSDR